MGLKKIAFTDVGFDLKTLKHTVRERNNCCSHFWSNKLLLLIKYKTVVNTIEILAQWIAQ